jgi:hypothetical protein
VELILRNLLTAVQAVHRILVVARPELAKARIEIIGPTHKVIGWVVVAGMERCRVEFHDVVTDRGFVFPAPVGGPGTCAPSDDPLLRPVDDAPPSLAILPQLVELILRHLLSAIQPVHGILAVVCPQLRRARIELIGPNDQIVGWLAVAGLGCMERCRLEIRDVHTGKELVSPALVTGPGAKPPSDDPMLRSQPKIPAPTGTQLAEIAELVGRLALTDGQVAAVLRRLKVRGGMEAISDYFTAQHVLGALKAMDRNWSRGSTAPTSLQRAKIADLVRQLALTDAQFAVVLRRYKVHGGAEAIADYATAQYIRGALKAMCRTRGIIAPTALQRAKIAELVRQLALSDGQFAEVLRRCGVEGGAEGVHHYATAQRVLCDLRSIRRIRRTDGRSDPLYGEAVDVVLESGRGSVSEVQRRLRVGCVRARTLIEGMEAGGILGPHCGDRPRKVLIGEVKDGHVEDLYDAAVKVVLDCGRGSGSELQRRLHIGYAVARRLIERMAGAGILGPARGNAPRKVLIGRDP